MNKNRDKVVFITGAARRIGKAIASHLHASGCRVVIHYRHSADEAQALYQTLNAERPDSAMLLQGDLLQFADFKSWMEVIIQQWGRLDALVNNASDFYKTPQGTVTEKQWDILLDTNAKAPFFLAEAAAPYLKQSSGCIVNIADIHGERPLRDYSAYCISKAALIMITRVLAKEYAPTIRVNAVSPGGGVVWPEGENSLRPEDKEKIIASTSLQSVGSPLDIARAVDFLMFDAGYVTGQVIKVDGGRKD